MNGAAKTQDMAPIADARHVERDLFIGGEWVAPRSRRHYESIDPYRGLPWATAPDADERDVDAAVSAARAALTGPWGQMTGFQRAKIMRRVGDLIARDAAQLAEVESRDSGKLLREMKTQLDYIPEWFYYFAGMADKLQGATIASDRPNYAVFTEPVPVGVVAAIVPWNSPLMLLVWKLAPAMAAGCTIVAKPSDQTPISTLRLARLVHEAGVPGGVFNVVTGEGPGVGKTLVDHPGVDKIAFTGSTQTGKAIAAAAAQNLTRTSLELGGKSAQLVFADADVEAAVNGVVAGVFAASGQTCMAGSRLIAHEDVHDELIQRIIARAARITIGDPLQMASEMGPVNNAAQRDKITAMIDEAATAGARVHMCGNTIPDTGGYFVRPTVVSEVAADSALFTDEVFGPVLAVSRFAGEDEATALANQSVYGLAAGVWTNNVRTAHRVARQLRVGTVWINAYRVVAPNVPFGGFRHSGLGRENGLEAVLEYTETRATWIELSGNTRDPFTIG